MTEKDYELVAQALADVNGKYGGEDWTFSGVLGLVAWKIADALEAKNPRFNREMFLKACGAN